MGIIYCLTNRSLPGLVKIGMTERDAESRAAQISAGTGVPEPFAVAWKMRVSDARKAERSIHKGLDRYRYTSNREFFVLTPEDARLGVLEILEVGDLLRTETTRVDDTEYSNAPLEVQSKRNILSKWFSSKS